MWERIWRWDWDEGDLADERAIGLGRDEGSESGLARGVVGAGVIDRDGGMDMEMDGYIYYIYGCEGRGRRRDSGDLGRRGGRIGG